MTRLEQLLDSEERNSQLLGALDALEDLVTNRAHGVDIRAEPLAYLLRLINQSAREALELPVSIGGMRSNDD